MGDPGRLRKRFEGPKRLWDKKRIEDEKALRTEFGLKNARELWRMQTMLRRIRREARRLLSSKGKDLERRTEQLLGRVKKFLIRNPDLKVDDVLLLTTKDILGRRLQTIVARKHLSKTVRGARQLITHGHIAVSGNKVTSPSYLVSFSEEDQISWFKKPIQLAAPAEGTASTPVKAEAAEEPATPAEAQPEAA
ncbi:30S ribosomal protein S4 [Candidatus Micrarchaeota archaeon]|nr:30S ribosomal protein S4 [Candidatus Micrarchaeota archaeon]